MFAHHRRSVFLFVLALTLLILAIPFNPAAGQDVFGNIEFDIINPCPGHEEAIHFSGSIRYQEAMEATHNGIRQRFHIDLGVGGDGSMTGMRYHYIGDYHITTTYNERTGEWSDHVRSNGTVETPGRANNFQMHPVFAIDTSSGVAVVSFDHFEATCGGH